MFRIIKLQENIANYCMCSFLIETIVLNQIHSCWMLYVEIISWCIRGQMIMARNPINLRNAYGINRSNVVEKKMTFVLETSSTKILTDGINSTNFRR